MSPVEPIGPDRLRSRCDPSHFSFKTTAELEDLEQVIGQARALEALEFGVGISHQGFNLYVLGPAGIGRHTVVRQYLEQQVQSLSAPHDWCYVNNFEDPRRPRMLRLPAGRGQTLRRDMEQLVDDLRGAIRVAFEAEEYQNRLQEIEESFKEQREQALSALAKEAEEQGIRLVRTPGGFAIAPVKDGEVLGPDEFDKLSEDERKRIEKVVGDLQEKLAAVFRQMPQWQREARSRVKGLNRDVAMYAVGHLIDEVKKSYEELPEVQEYLDAVQDDVVENVDQFMGQEEGPSLFRQPEDDAHKFRRYEVNALISHDESKTAPVVYEDSPTYQNLVGAIEHSSQMGALVTDFTLIKPGALHRANGGFLVLDAHKVLTHGYSWEGLKRALKSKEIRIESLGHIFSIVATVSLEPEPIPLDTKVVLIGSRLLYYLLSEYDPEFSELFKVSVDFDDQMERTPESYDLYARLVATVARKDKLRPFDRGAVARVIEQSARFVEDAERLSTHLLSVSDLLRESDYWAGKDGRDTVTQSDVQHAIDMSIRRSDRIRARVYEEIGRGTVLIDTEGEKAGQVNGISVITLSSFSFGQPSRITATVRLGEGEVIDIEREVELGGSIHSKGVLILSSFLGSRYAGNRPLSVKASLVFEQSYGMIEGDSASLGELCALLSTLGRVPVRQSLAITGSVNQHGQVQAIGGVNEKIEGFFDVCAARGLTGEQGVIVPESNVQHLMLRDDVVQAVSDGQFHIYPVTYSDQAMELLTGRPAGERDASGEYPRDSLNYAIEARLIELADYRQEFVRAGKESDDE